MSVYNSSVKRDVEAINNLLKGVTPADKDILGTPLQQIF